MNPAAGRRMPAAESNSRSPRYEICVRGQLGELMLGAFPSLVAHMRGEQTVLTGVLEDQAALHGVLAQIEARGLELLEVRRLPAA